MESYESLSSQYEKGAKKISFHSKRPKVSVKTNPDIKIEKSHGNYDLHFNKDGFLVQSFHFERGEPTKIIYAYDNKKRINRMMKLKQETNILIESAEYIYDKKDQIEKEIHTVCYNHYDNVITEWSYTYKKNLEIMLIHSSDEESCSSEAFEERVGGD